MTTRYWDSQSTADVRLGANTWLGAYKCVDDQSMIAAAATTDSFIIE